MLKMMGGAASGGKEVSIGPFQKASKTWKSFDWPSKKAQWESTTVENKESREAAQAARKQLAETTKLLKRAVKSIEVSGKALGSSQSEETVAAAIKAIETLSKQARVTVKSYQEEIDNLTRRSKATESAFDKLTQALHDVQDPSGLLVDATEQLNSQQQQILQLTQKVEEVSKENLSLDARLKQSIKDQKAAEPSAAMSSTSKEEKEELIELRREVAEYEVEFRSLKNQDITIRKLEKKIEELQLGGEAEFEAKLEAAKQELIETEGRRTTEALEREAAMERKVETLQLQLKAEAAGRAATNTHMLEATEGAGEREAAWDAQRRILVDDADRMRVMLHEATRERDDLRLKVAALDGTGKQPVSAPSSGGISMNDLLNERKAYEAEVSELSHTVNSLREQISVKDDAMLEENKSLLARIDRLEHENSKLTQDLSHTAEQLEAAPSKSLVEGMKRELRILKRLEYNAEDPEMPESDPEIAGRNEDGKDFESVLVAKLRRVETELVKERNQNAEAAKEHESLVEEMKKLEESKAEADKVIASLEQDLDRAISSSTTTPATPSKTPKKEIMPMAPSDPSALQSVLDPTAPSPLPPMNSPPPAAQASLTSAEERISDDRSVANIIMAQRDRLRTRCDALEAERDSFKRELQAQVDAAESLRADNTKLFEKMRYLQNYGNKSASSNRTYARKDSRDLDLEALEQRYEASVDPFKQFSKTERQRKLQQMSPMERTVYVVAKAMLGTREMRTFLFFYVLAMHVLVFSTTYHWSHNESGTDCMLLNEAHSHLPPVHDHSKE